MSESEGKSVDYMRGFAAGRHYALLEQVDVIAAIHRDLKHSQEVVEGWHGKAVTSQ